MRIRTGLVELIYIPSISNLMLLEEGLNLPLLDFDQIYTTCLSTLKYSPPRIGRKELMYNFQHYLRFFLYNNTHVNVKQWHFLQNVSHLLCSMSCQIPVRLKNGNRSVMGAEVQLYCFMLIAVAHYIIGAIFYPFLSLNELQEKNRRITRN